MRLTSIRSRGGFTLIELLVVISIIAILVASIVTGGSVLVTRGRVKSTQATLTIVQQAIEQFEADKPTIISARQRSGSDTFKYKDRFGGFPPDELEVFTGQGLTRTPDGGRSLAPAGAAAFPSPPPEYGDMTFQLQGLAIEDQAYEHRDLAAMILAIELYSEAGREILSKVPDRHRTEGVVDPSSNEPVLFLDRDDNDKWDVDDRQIRLLVDDWGVPLVYYSQRDFLLNNAPASETASSNGERWNQASTEMIRLNMSQPIIMSYGPNGKYQLSQSTLAEEPTALLHDDWSDGRKVDNSLNEDNVYVDSAFAEKLGKGGLQ